MHHELEVLLRKYGTSCLAYSTLQSGMEQHLLPDVGYIAFARRQAAPAATIALGEPVAHQASKSLLLDSFLAEHPQSAFAQLRGDSAVLLAERGFYVNKMGSEMRIELAQFRLSGPRRRSLRSALRKGREQGIEFRELLHPAAEAVEMQRVSAEWIKGRPLREREYAFLSRSARFEAEDGVRKFGLFSGGELCAFAFFDPVYRDGSVLAYAASVQRALPNQGFSLQDLLLLHAGHVFAAEGVEALNLGLMPFHGLGGVDEIRPSPLTRSIFEQIYRRGAPLANCAALSWHKSRFGGREIPVYFASRSALPLTELYACSRFTGLRPVRQLLRHGLLQAASAFSCYRGV